MQTAAGSHPPVPNPTTWLRRFTGLTA